MPRQSLWLGNIEGRPGMKVRSRRLCRNFWHCFCAIVSVWVDWARDAGIVSLSLALCLYLQLGMSQVWHRSLHQSPVLQSSMPPFQACEATLIVAEAEIHRCLLHFLLLLPPLLLFSSSFLAKMELSWQIACATRSRALLVCVWGRGWLGGLGRFCA